MWGDKMSKNIMNIADFVVTSLGAINPALGIAGSALSVLIKKEWEQRLTHAFKCLEDAFREQKISLEEFCVQHEAANVFIRLQILLRNGAARENMQIMAQVAAGMVARHKLFPNEFDKYAHHIERLSRDEIIIIALMKDIHDENNSSFNEKDEINYINILCERYNGNLFETRGHIFSILMSSCASGLVILSVPSFGGMSFTLSPILHEIWDLSDFKEALRKEGVSLD